MTKNAYEIRLDVLQMAHSDAYQLYHNKLDTIRNEQGFLDNADSIEALTPKTADIIKRAEELYKFVEDRGL